MLTPGGWSTPGKGLFLPAQRQAERVKLAQALDADLCSHEQECGEGMHNEGRRRRQEPCLNPLTLRNEHLGGSILIQPSLP